MNGGGHFNEDFPLVFHLSVCALFIFYWHLHQIRTENDLKLFPSETRICRKKCKIDGGRPRHTKKKQLCAQNKKKKKNSIEHQQRRHIFTVRFSVFAMQTLHIECIANKMMEHWSSESKTDERTQRHRLWFDLHNETSIMLNMTSTSKQRNGDKERASNTSTATDALPWVQAQGQRAFCAFAKLLSAQCRLHRVHAA